jgi:predicted MPP superfamily phosphohydrolase
MAAGAIGTVALSGYAEQAAYDLRVERRTLRLPQWDADGFRVAMLADVHVNFAQAAERTRQAVELALNEKPDLFAVVGDFVNSGSPQVLRFLIEAFDRVHSARCPCLAVLGNHDYWVWDPTDVADAVRTAGFTLLRNEAVELDGVTVAGLDDALMHRARYEFLREGAFSPSLLTLLHEPDFVDQVPKNASLQLSGHSHGGQMCLPLGIPVHLPKGGRKYPQGYYPDAPRPLYVTRGVGTTGLDFRTFCPPEVTVLTLTGA